MRPNQPARERQALRLEPARIAALLAPFLPEPLEESQITALGRYLDLLLRWNQQINLTAIRDPEQIVTRHFGESLFAASRLFSHADGPATRLVDVGSGAGFPGLPARIVTSEKDPIGVTLIESRQRKVAFLREAARVLGFPDVEVFHGRAQEYRPPAAAQLVVTMRAVERFDEALAAAAGIVGSWRQPSGLASATVAEPPGARLALLIGAEQVARARQLEPGLEWGPPIAMPLSSRRVLVVGKAVFRPG